MVSILIFPIHVCRRSLHLMVFSISFLGVSNLSLDRHFISLVYYYYRFILRYFVFLLWMRLLSWFLSVSGSVCLRYIGMLLTLMGLFCNQLLCWKCLSAVGVSWRSIWELPCVECHLQIRMLWLCPFLPLSILFPSSVLSLSIIVETSYWIGLDKLGTTAFFLT